MKTLTWAYFIHSTLNTCVILVECLLHRDKFEQHYDLNLGNVYREKVELYQSLHLSHLPGHISWEVAVGSKLQVAAVTCRVVDHVYLSWLAERKKKKVLRKLPTMWKHVHFNWIKFRDSNVTINTLWQFWKHFICITFTNNICSEIQGSILLRLR